MNDSRTLSLYVHRCKAQEAEIDRLHAALRQQRELLGIYADGWRHNYDECGRITATEKDCGCQDAYDALEKCEEEGVRLTQRIDEMRGENEALLNQIREHRQEVWRATDALKTAQADLAACQKERAEWKGEALGLRDQLRDVSAQLRQMHAEKDILDAEWMPTVSQEENHRDAG